MKDQVDALCRHGVKASNLDSTLSADRAAWVKEEVLSGNMKILYVAPERCVTPGSKMNVDNLHALEIEQRVFHRAYVQSQDLTPRCGRVALYITGTCDSRRSRTYDTQQMIVGLILPT
jgi:tellurite resistance-related uncharacterized protein